MINKTQALDVITTLFLGVAIFFVTQQGFLHFYEGTYLNQTGKQFVRYEQTPVNIENTIEIKRNQQTIEEIEEKITLDDFNNELEFLEVNDKRFFIIKDVETIGSSFLNYREIDDIQYLYSHSNDGSNNSSFVGDYLFNNIGLDERLKTSEVSLVDINNNTQKLKVIDEFNFKDPEDLNLELKKGQKVLYTCVPGTQGDKKRGRVLDIKK